MKKVTILLAALLTLLMPLHLKGDGLGDWEINDYLTFTATTHQFSTGAAYAATGNVNYRIYEDDTTNEIVTDTAMTAFDSVTGLYLARVQLLSATGFEAGKCYTILMSATVDSVSGICTHHFGIRAVPSDLSAVKAKTDNLPDDPADDSDIDAAIAAVDGKIDTAQADLDTITGGAGVLIDDDAITSAKFDESTAFPITENIASGLTNWNAAWADSTFAATILAMYDGTGIDSADVFNDLGGASDIVNEWKTQSQADPTLFHVNVMEFNGVAQTGNDVGGDVDSVLTLLQAFDTPAEAKALFWGWQMSDLSGAPPYNAYAYEVPNYLYMAWRNMYVSDNNNKEVRVMKNNGTDVAFEADYDTVSNVFTRQAYGAED